MKGISVSGEFVGNVVIMVFIVGVIAIVVSNFLPAFGGDACRQKQSESMNRLINDAVSARAETVRNFDVEGSCVEYINFDCTTDSGPCYKIRYIGKSEDVPNDLPGSQTSKNVIEISCDGCGDKEPLKLLKGSYIARISPYTIKFSRELCDDKTKPECQPVPA